MLISKHLKGSTNPRGKKWYIDPKKYFTRVEQEGYDVYDGETRVYPCPYAYDPLPISENVIDVNSDDGLMRTVVKCDKDLLPSLVEATRHMRDGVCTQPALVDVGKGERLPVFTGAKELGSCLKLRDNDSANWHIDHIWYDDRSEG